MNRFHLAGVCVLAIALTITASYAEDAPATVASSTPQMAEAAAPVVATPPASAASAEVKPAAEEKPEAKPVAAAPVATTAEPIVIDYNEADIQSVLRTLAAKAGINLILGDEVAGKVSVHLEGVGYEDAMKLVVESKAYAV